MSWIELHEAVRDLWKIRRLAEKAAVRYAEAEGWVVNLWLWAMSNAPKGNLDRFTDEEIKSASRVETDLKNYGKILVECELLNEKRSIHNWKKYGIKHLEQSRKRLQKFRNSRGKSETFQKRIGNVTETTNQPYRTVPTLPNQPKSLTLGTATTFQPEAGNGKTAHEADPALVEEVAGFIGGRDSRAFLKTVVRTQGAAFLRLAFGELKMRVNEGTVDNKGAYLVTLCKEWAEERKKRLAPEERR